MKLTDSVKQAIDSKTLEDLLRAWRFAPVGDPWFQGEVGEYWQKRMNELRAVKGHDAWTTASKKIGW